MTKFVRPKEVLSLVAISKSEVARLEKSGRFPRRIALTPRCTAYILQEIEDWIAERIAERGQSSVEQQRLATGKKLSRARAAAPLAERGTADVEQRRADVGRRLKQGRAAAGAP